MSGFHVRISLDDTSPQVIRYVKVPTEITFLQLHQSIQVMFGWRNYHSFYFDLSDAFIRIQNNEDEPYNDRTILQAQETTLSSFLKKGDVLTYLYDMGDNWQHTLFVEEFLPDYDQNIPMLTDWEEDNLVEDCGGPSGYRMLMEKLKDHSNPISLELHTWYLQQHVMFHEGVVNECLSAIRKPIQNICELTSSQQEELSALLMELHNVLSKKYIEELCCIQVKKEKGSYIVAISQLENDYSIQLYEDQESYLRGVEFASSTNSYNFYANAFSFIFSEQPMPLFEGWMSEDNLCIAKRLQPGFLPMDLSQIECQSVCEHLKELHTLLLSYPKPKLPCVKDMMMLIADESHHLQKQPYQLTSSYVAPHFHKEAVKHWKDIEFYAKEAKFDILCLPPNTAIMSMEIPILLILEIDDDSFEQFVNPEQLQSFETLNDFVIDWVFNFMLSNGRFKSIYVNNENCHMMLKGICEDFHVHLKYQDFVTRLEQQLMENSANDEMEYLEQILNMDEAELQSLMADMEEEDLSAFKQFLLQYLPEDEDIMNLDKKPYFDA